MDRSTTQTLEALPEELVSNIAARLHADDIAALRLVSRSLQQKSFHEFAKEYFSEKCFMFTTDSLKVLVAIANSDRLRAYLRHVHFMTAVFSDRAFKCPRGCQCSWQPSIKQSEAFRGYIEDQKILQSTARDKQMLAEAFANLPSLSTISVDDTPSMLPVNVDYRGNNKVPRLCGRPPICAPYGFSDESFKEYDTFFQHVWDVVMQAMQHAVSLTHFATHLGKATNGVPVPFLDSTKFAKSMPAFKTLNALLLRIRSNERAGLTDDRKLDDITEHELTVLHSFAKGLSSLQVLDLSFDSSRPTGAYLIAFTSGLKLSALTTLYLDGVAINAKALLGILRRLNSVKDLRLVFTNIAAGSWVSVLKALQNMTGHLQHLHLMYLLEAGRKVYFLKQIEEDFEDEFFDSPGEHDSDLSDDDDDYTDEDLPPLEPAETMEYTSAQDDDITDIAGNATNEADSAPSSIPVVTDAPTTQGPSITSVPIAHSAVDHSRPGDLGSGERGYYVCLQGAQIAAQLPTFIEEYNLGQDVEEAMGMPGVGGVGPPPTLNNFMNMVGAALGVPGVPPPPAGSTVGGVAIPINLPPLVPFGPAPPPPAPSTANTSQNANANPNQNIDPDAALDFLWDNLVEHEWENEEEMSDLD